MIKCKHCQYKYEYTGKPCPVCGSAPVIDKEEIEQAQRELEIAISQKNTAKILVCRHILADGVADAESIREYAKLLERSEDRRSSTDTVMNYYYLAAKLADCYSAYRYSRLVGRISERAANFWLRFSAVLGSIDAYPHAAELFSSEGREDIASYYYTLAAACDDTDSIVNMAKRWYSGIGVEANISYAKWYLDKITIPPISVIKLAYKIRSAHAEEPDKLVFPDYQAYIKTLAEEAKQLNYPTAEFHLISILAKGGNINAGASLGIMLMEGKGCDKDTAQAKEQLDATINAGNPAGAVYLGQEFCNGKNFDIDPNLAIEYFKKAADLGFTDAYEKIGDLYRAGEIVEKDIAKAIEFYELAAAGGGAGAKEKAAELKAAREKFYLDAYKTINLNSSVTHDEAFEAFKGAAIATAMGEVRAMPLLAKCYASAFGTEQDRQSAFFWFKKAAEAGDIESRYALALCYSRGYGTAFSYQDAIKNLKFAQNAGIETAASELDKLYRRRMNKMVRSLYSKAMRLIYSKKYSEAVKLLTAFETLAYPKALYTLGCLYEFGRGVPKSDRVRASSYYERASVGNTTFGSFHDPASKYKLQILKMVR